MPVCRWVRAYHLLFPLLQCDALLTRERACPCRRAGVCCHVTACIHSCVALNAELRQRACTSQACAWLQPRNTATPSPVAQIKFAKPGKHSSRFIIARSPLKYCTRNKSTVENVFLHTMARVFPTSNASIIYRSRAGIAPGPLPTPLPHVGEDEDDSLMHAPFDFEALPVTPVPIRSTSVNATTMIAGSIMNGACDANEETCLIGPVTGTETHSITANENNENVGIGAFNR